MFIDTLEEECHWENVKHFTDFKDYIIIIIIIIIIKKGRQCKAERVLYTLSVRRPQPHNTNL